MMEEPNFARIHQNTVIQKGTIIRELMKDGSYKYFSVGDCFLQMNGFEIKHIGHPTLSLIITLKKTSMISRKYEVQKENYE